MRRRPQVPGTHHAGPGAGGGSSATIGGVKTAVGTKPGRMQLRIGDEGYLWILVLLEVAALAWGRKVFKRYHGG